MGRLIAETLGSIAATTYTPVALFKAAYDQPFRATLPERFGGGAWLNKDLSTYDIWLHGASVGEIEGLAPVAKAIKTERIESNLLITTTTPTGQESAKQKKLDADFRILPFDHPWVLKKLFKSTNIKLFLQFETEIWPNLLFKLHDLGVPVVIVNGRVSDRSFPRYSLARGFFRHVLAGVERCLVQTQVDAERYSYLGVEPIRIEVVGCTKYDASARPDPENIERFRSEIGLGSRRLITFGSVRPGEEEPVAATISRLLASEQSIQIAVACRHADRHHLMLELLRRGGAEVSMRSAGPNTKGARIVFLDVMGELKLAYASSKIAFVGGTMTEIGGHNVMEPAMFGVPVVCGVHVNNVRDAVAQLRATGGIEQVESADGLYEVISKWVASESDREAAGAGALAAFESNLGATDKVLSQIRPLLDVTSRK